MVRAVVEIAGALGLETIAEGVETRGQFDALAHLGCDVAQGFLLSRPVPEAHAAALLDGTAALGQVAPHVPTT
jgi:EAL domain-containing protein (putative c-di-GMP-specific phosphodiesterase class I)